MIKANSKFIGKLLLLFCVLSVFLLTACEKAAPPPAKSNDSAAPPSGEASSSITFTTKDLDNNTVTEAIFALADFTLVDVWSVDCGPCINNLKVVSELPLNVQGLQVIGIVADEKSQDNPSIARDIMQQEGADFNVLLLSESLYEGLLKDVKKVPTHFLINSSGELIAGPITGAKSEKEFVDWLKPYLDR